MKPTDEQIKELWEWCGFKAEYRQFGYQLGTIIQPDGRRRDEYPSIDLNNLFKYAEQPLVNHFIETTNTEEEYRQAYYEFLCKWLKDYIWNEPHDPALALFWAIYEVLK